MLSCPGVGVCKIDKSIQQYVKSCSSLRLNLCLSGNDPHPSFGPAYSSGFNSRLGRYFSGRIEYSYCVMFMRQQ